MRRGGKVAKVPLRCRRIAEVHYKLWGYIFIVVVVDVRAAFSMTSSDVIFFSSMTFRSHIDDEALTTLLSMQTGF